MDVLTQIRHDPIEGEYMVVLETSPHVDFIFEALFDESTNYTEKRLLGDNYKCLPSVPEDQTLWYFAAL